MTRPYRRAFTLIELMIALAIGLLVSALATAAFAATQRFVQRVETVGARTEAVQSMILWCLAKPGAETAYPTGRQFRAIGGAIEDADPVNGRHLTAVVTDHSSGTAVVTARIPLPGLTR